MRVEGRYRVVRSLEPSFSCFHGWTSESPPLAPNLHGGSDCFANHRDDDWAGIRSAYAAELLARVAACHVDGPSGAAHLVVLRLRRLLRSALERPLTTPFLPSSAGQNQTGAGSATPPAGGSLLPSPHAAIARSIQARVSGMAASTWGRSLTHRNLNCGCKARAR